MKKPQSKKIVSLSPTQLAAEFASDEHTSALAKSTSYLQKLRDSIDGIGEFERALKTTNAFLDLGADSVEQREKKIRIRECQQQLQELKKYVASKIVEDGKVDVQLDLQLKVMGAFLTEIILMIVKLYNTDLLNHLNRHADGAIGCNADEFLMRETPDGSSRDKTRVFTNQVLSKIKKHLPKTHQMFYSDEHPAVYKKPGTTFGRRLRGREFRDYEIIQIQNKKPGTKIPHDHKYVAMGFHGERRWVFQPINNEDTERRYHPLSGGFMHHQRWGVDYWHGDSTEAVIKNYCVDIQREFASEGSHPALARIPIMEIYIEWKRFLEPKEGGWLSWNQVVCGLPS